MSAKSARTRRGAARTVGKETTGTSAASAGKDARRTARANVFPSPRRWAQMVAITSAVALLLAASVVALNLLSVEASGRISVTGKSDSSPSDPKSKGSLSAPVVITEWFDFQCPACGRFALTRKPEIVRLYVDTGKARWVSRNYAFLGLESLIAAEAAEAAAAQGRYWDYYTLLFQRQRGENQGAFRPDNLKGFAAQLGLDQKAFNDALDRGVHRAAVLAERKEGEALGVNATPTLFINGRKLEGVPTVEQLGKLIEEEMATKR